MIADTWKSFKRLIILRKMILLEISTITYDPQNILSVTFYEKMIHLDVLAITDDPQNIL